VKAHTACAALQAGGSPLRPHPHRRPPGLQQPARRFLHDNPIETRLAVAHIRKKTRGATSLANNTHPFVRVFQRRHLVFAHNGTLPDVRGRPLARETPLGDADSGVAAAGSSIARSRSTASPSSALQMPPGISGRGSYAGSRRTAAAGSRTRKVKDSVR
jgi:predicted glutamine amidotransferase